jgi:hypothetical protein
MSIRIVSNKLRCSPFGNLGGPRLTVLALIASPPDRTVIKRAAAP